MQQPVYPGHAHIEEAVHLAPHELGRDGRLLGDGYIRGPGRDHQYPPLASFLDSTENECQGTGRRVMVRLGMGGAHGCGLVLINPGDQDIVPIPLDRTEDGDHLLGRLSLGQDDLGKSLPKVAVRIDLGESEILERKAPYRLHCVFHVLIAPPHRFQQFLQPCFVHFSAPRL